MSNRALGLSTRALSPSTRALSLSKGTPARRAVTAVVGLAGLGLGCLGYAALYEVRAFQLRRASVPILPPGSRDIRILHISDLHLTPADRARQRWVSRLAGLEPDLVVSTGDHLAHPDSVPYVIGSLGRLLERPGAFVLGSNDYYAPTFKNPITYLTQPNRQGQERLQELPWRDLQRELMDAGWLDLTHRTETVEIKGVRLALRGVDDAHLNRDRYAEVAGAVDPVDVAIGVSHAPYLRVLDAMTADGLDLILAGHTHGGQVCVPIYGALVTNCDLDTGRVKGLSTHSAAGRTAYLHVSAGLGTSPYAPIRFACPPEATLLMVTARSAESAKPAPA